MTDLASHAALELDRLIVVDELQLLEHGDPLLVVGQKLEILVAQRHTQPWRGPASAWLALNEFGNVAAHCAILPSRTRSACRIEYYEEGGH